MTTMFFTADLHLGHEKVAKMRGFADTIAHDMKIVRTWCNTVSENDDVYVLGDISSGIPTSEKIALWILSELPGRKHLIAGNHDSVSGIHRHGYKQMKDFMSVFESVRDFGRIRHNKQDILLSHYPYAQYGDGLERGGIRYEQWRLPDLGAPLIHGHTHQKNPFELDKDLMCVSWDSWNRLVTMKDINDWRNNA